MPDHLNLILTPGDESGSYAVSDKNKKISSPRVGGDLSPQELVST